MPIDPPRRLAVLAVFLAPLLSAQQAASRAVEHTLATHERSLYFTIPPKQKAAQHPLLVVLPGGDGTRDFLPFVENGILDAAPEDCVGVLVTAVKWTEEQQIVWPTSKSKVKGMRYTTEDYVLAVVDAVAAEHVIDPTRIAVLAWSSSGPVAYLLTTAKKTPFERGYIAMSVYRPVAKATLRPAKKRRFVLDQSPDDQVTTFDHVQRAFASLDKAGAEVKLSTYSGGHGWNDAPLPRLRTNLTWLFGDKPAPAPSWPSDRPEVQRDGNLLQNAGFEDGAKGWREIDNSGRLTVAADTQDKVEGKRALHLSKTGGPPLDLLLQEVALPEGRSVTFAVRAKTSGAGNAWIKVWLYDENDEVVAKDADVARLQGDAAWQRYEKSWDRGGAVRAVVQVVMVMGGEVWLDDAALLVTK
ncbi:MAG: carbohydrate binding domain-containing protein [Planctomycetes bacterium]|nr:carbohydrate binding domain-containing protein [Planctomycetota bacterium]